jgi:TolB-like protein/DNA-binding winged helix-turn-helix (wHTH) protein/Tfp pilus assembly protein PilF
VETREGSTQRWSFGIFEVDTHNSDLRRSGTPVKLREQSFRILVLLLERAGDIVTREELRQALWPSDTYVDFDHSLNTAIMKLRDALGDSADKPLYIETIPKRGYRFVAPVSVPLTAQNPIASPEGDSPAPRAGHGRRLAWLVGGTAALLILGFVTTWFLRWHSSTAPIRSLAVLPLENLSGDTSQEYFADGMTDELITELARIPGLRVVSRSSVMREKGTHKPLDQIARELNVDAVVEGSVIRVADKVRITARLTDTRDDKDIWAQSFEGRAGDILSMQDDVAREIASQAKLALTPAARAGTGDGKRIDPAAYDAYLRGRYFMDRRDPKKSTDYFQQAIAIDPTYAAAFAGLADALHFETASGVVPLAEGFPKALAAAKHAIELDPMNGEAYSALGTVEGEGDWNWEAAGRDLRRGIALNPSDSLAVVQYANYLGVMGRPDEAVAKLRHALETDPLSFYLNRQLGVMLYFERHYDEALYHLRRAGEMDPSEPSTVEYWANAIYEKKGMQDEAVRSDLKAYGQDPPQADVDTLRSAYQRGGWKAYQKAKIELMSPHADTYCVPYRLAVSHLRLEEVDRAFSFLQQAMDQHCWAVMNLKVDPLLDSIRSDPRYHELLQRMNLAE